MKITKVNTSSFAISRNLEKKAKKRFDRIKSKEKGKVSPTLSFKYAPLAEFRAQRREQTASSSLEIIGIKKSMHAEKEGYFYANLKNAELKYVSRKTRGGVELGSVDFLERLIDLPSRAISGLGYLIDSGTVYREKLDEDIVHELVSHSLADEFRWERNIFFNYFLREMTDITGGEVPRGEIEYVKPAYKIPRFGDIRYDLSRFTEVDDTIEGTYTKDPIKFSEQQIREVINLLFRCKSELVAVVYMPYAEIEYTRGGVEAYESYPILCLKRKTKKEYEHPFKLRPISMATGSIGARLVPSAGSAITFNEVGNLEHAKNVIRRRVITPLKNPQLAKKFKTEMGGGILFYGPPGCGKTYLARATVGEIGGTFIAANIADIMGEGPDIAAGKIRDIFEYARSGAPSVLFFDEIDVIGSRRDDHHTLVSGAALNQLLIEMDGVSSSNEEILVIGATNMPWRIDPALVRAGRFGEQIFVPPPDHSSRVEIFRICTRDLPMVSPVEASGLADMTEGYSAADIKTICDFASTMAYEEALKTGKSRGVSSHHLQNAVRERRSSLIPWFKVAESEMEEAEGSKETYHDLWEATQEFNKKMKGKHRKEYMDEYQDTPELKKMIEKWKDDIELKK